jgi:ADP-ribose pyrophosphatase YjhB (NUDIX family)
MRQEIALALIRSGDAVLLVKGDYGLHLWALPGGRVEPGESFAAAAVREVEEETGLRVEVRGVVAFRDREDQACVVFATEVRGGTPLRAVPGEIEDIRWFDLGAMERAERGTDDLTRLLVRRELEAGLPVLAIELWRGRDGSSAQLFV